MLLVGVVLFRSYITYNPSDSSTTEGWYMTHWNASFTKGDIVRLYEPLKEVAAAPGDIVIFSSKGMYVNGKLLPNSAPESGIPHFPYGEYVVPPDMYLGVGTRNPDSWDGRYYGFLPKTVIAGPVTPLWTSH